MILITLLAMSQIRPSNGESTWACRPIKKGEKYEYTGPEPDLNIYETCCLRFNTDKQYKCATRYLEHLSMIPILSSPDSASVVENQAKRNYLCCMQKCLKDVSDQVCPGDLDFVGPTKEQDPLPRPLPDAFGSQSSTENWDYGGNTTDYADQLKIRPVFPMATILSYKILLNKLSD